MATQVTAGLIKPAASVSYTEAKVAVDFVLIVPTDIKLDPFFKYRAFNETVIPVELVALSLTKPFADLTELSDVSTLNVGKVFTETLSFAENYSYVMAYARSFADSGTLVEAVAKAYGKNLSEGVTFSESVLIVIGPILYDTITVSDGFVVDYGKASSETLVVSETVAKAIGKFLTETLTATDLLMVDGSNVKSDSASAGDALAWAFGKALTDGLSTSENFSILLRNVNSSMLNEAALNDFTLNG